MSWLVKQMKSVTLSILESRAKENFLLGIIALFEVQYVC